MSDQPLSTSGSGEFADPKGKGKAPATEPSQDMSMDEDDESSSEEEAGEEEPAVEEEDEDNMEEISTDNIISDGRRTRGKTIDFAEAAAKAGDELDDDEDDDEDFVAKDDDAMQE